ncbi:unnamed protein product [Nippostrongylus brasiliensis]|uniref:Deoxyribonuclease TATDN2 n=1 Tax=Nippostrongylus brasiliensis TaxID=27835 RepID=A0A0N4XDE5_NIPBR|nr:unnamed protein product [Nippostrongylus brasiliensis]
MTTPEQSLTTDTLLLKLKNLTTTHLQLLEQMPDCPDPHQLYEQVIGNIYYIHRTLRDVRLMDSKIELLNRSDLPKPTVIQRIETLQEQITNIRLRFQLARTEFEKLDLQFGVMKATGTIKQAQWDQWMHQVHFDVDATPLTTERRQLDDKIREYTDFLETYNEYLVRLKDRLHTETATEQLSNRFETEVIRRLSSIETLLLHNSSGKPTTEEPAEHQPSPRPAREVEIVNTLDTEGLDVTNASDMSENTDPTHEQILISNNTEFMEELDYDEEPDTHHPDHLTIVVNMSNENKDPKTTHTYSDIRHEVSQSFIDSHCHLDFLHNRHGSNDWNNSSSKFGHPYFSGCIPNFVNPAIFTEYSVGYDPEWLKRELQNPFVLGATYGCHPHFSHQYGHEIRKLLKPILEAQQRYKCLAIGECGLDYKRNDVDATTQKRVFMAQLLLAKEHDLPIVIHCRSGPRGDAESDCLQVMQQAELPTSHLIHRHCFSESWKVAKRWLQEYTNIHFAFTSICASWENPKHKNKWEVLEKLPLGKILLETDGPYFKPAQYHSLANNDTRDDVSYPPMAVNVAFIIARAKNIDVNEVIKTTTENTRRVTESTGKRTPATSHQLKARPTPTPPSSYAPREVFTIPKTPSDTEKPQTARQKDDNHKDSIRDLKDQLREARASRAAAEERLKVLTSQRHITRMIGSETPDNNIPSTLTCAFCKRQGCHFSDACPIVINSTTRKDMINKGRRCSTCLKTHAKYLKCNKHDEPCRYCKQAGHHCALCDIPEIAERTREEIRDTRETIDNFTFIISDLKKQIHRRNRSP